MAVALVLASLPVGVASGQEPEENVRLLVETDRPLGAQTQRLDRGSPWKRVEVAVKDNLEKTIELLERATGVRVIVERRYETFGPEDEPLYSGQWGLRNTGQSGGTLGADVDAETAWDIATGDGVVVAVIDSGVRSTHPDLDAQFWVNAAELVNGVDDDGNGFVDDVVGWDFVDGDPDPSPAGTSGDDAHGTFVAGVLAAEVNGEGITGIAPDVKIKNSATPTISRLPRQIETTRWRVSRFMARQSTLLPQVTRYGRLPLPAMSSRPAPRSAPH